MAALARRSGVAILKHWRVQGVPQNQNVPFTLSSSTVLLRRFFSDEVTDNLPDKSQVVTDRVISDFQKVDPSSEVATNAHFLNDLDSQITDSTLTLKNETENELSMHSSTSASDAPLGSLLDENGVVQMMDEQEREEEEVYEIDMDKLENVRSLLQSSADGSFESSLCEMNLTLHQDFVIKIIETPFILGENLIRFFRWAWNEKSSNITSPSIVESLSERSQNEKSFKITSRVVESLVLAICSGSALGLKKKEIYSLWDLVKDIGETESGVLNVQILNEVIISFSKLGKGKAALEAFNKFEAFQCVPNADTYYFTIEALCRRSCFDWAWSICQKMLDAQSLPDSEKVGKILSWFCKGKMAKEAHAVYMASIEKRLYPPMPSFNFLVAKLCQENETVKIALEMLNDIPGEQRKHAIKPFLAVVRALCRIKDVDTAKQLILKMIAEGPPPGNAVFNFIISGYSKVGEMGQAMELMKLMESRGLKPDVFTYTVIMSGYSNGGELEEARKILAEARKKHSKLSPVMFHILIRGYCKLEQFDKALKLLTEMKEFGVRPSVDEYEKLIQSLCLKALDWEMAEKLHEEMKESGLHLKGQTRALIRAVKEMDKELLEAGNISSVA